MGLDEGKGKMVRVATINVGLGLVPNHALSLRAKRGKLTVRIGIRRDCFGAFAPRNDGVDVIASRANAKRGNLR